MLMLYSARRTPKWRFIIISSRKSSGNFTVRLRITRRLKCLSSLILSMIFTSSIKSSTPLRVISQARRLST